MVNIAPRHVWAPHADAMVAFVGLEGDVQSLSQELQAQVAAKLVDSSILNAGSRSKVMSPRTLASLTSHLLYRGRGRYYVEPLVVGLQPSSSRGESSSKPFLCAMDMIGAKSHSKAFVCAGAASKSLYGTAEALWRPNLSAEDLAKVCGKAFQSALERDCYSGYGALVYLITQDGGIVEYDMPSRND